MVLFAAIPGGVVDPSLLGATTPGFLSLITVPPMLKTLLSEVILSEVVPE